MRDMTNDQLRARVAKLEALLPEQEKERDTLGEQTWEGREKELEVFNLRADAAIRRTTKELAAIKTELEKRAQRESD